MVEADELCDRVAIINDGRVLACDRPAALKRRLQGEVIFHLETTRCDETARSALEAAPGVRRATWRDTEAGAAVELRLEDEQALGAVLAVLQGHDVRLVTVTKREPTLEDVFVDLVGRSMADVERAHAPLA
jgi:ABC-2 type transport system ATP-binding protein